jgi:transposase
MVVLGYSRLLWVRFFTRKDMRALLAGLEEAFGFFGGVPQELLFDQMKSVITKDGRLNGEKLVTNGEFVRYAAHWGFKVRACRPYRAKTKGKVERPISYVRQAFIYGREFLGRRPRRAAPAVARAHGQRPDPPDHERAARVTLRARRAGAAAAASCSRLSVARGTSEASPVGRHPDLRTACPGAHR